MAKDLKPFSSASEPETIEDYIVSDGRGNSVPILKRGCLTPNEFIAIEEARINLYKDRNNIPPQSKVMLAEVAAFARERLENPKIDAQYVAERIKTFSLIRAIHVFLEGEQREWAATNFEMEFKGVEARNEAIAFAEKKPGRVAATRADLAMFNRWVVFRSRDDVPEDYTVEGEGKENPQSDE